MESNGEKKPFVYTATPDTITPENMGLFFTPTIHSDTYPAIDPTKLNLAGKSVLITGGNKGIGRALAFSYAKAGASHIALSVRRPVPDLEEALLTAARAAGKPEPKIHILFFDVCDLEAIKRGAEQLRQRVGRLDVLINNAGFMPLIMPLEEQPEEDYWKGWEVNYRGTYWVTKAFLPLMIECGGDKTVVVMTSVGAQQVGNGGGAYTIAKFALCRFAEYINWEFGDRGVIAYSVHPGGVPTDTSARLPPEIATFIIDTPELAGDSIVFLTSERREWLGGRYLVSKWDIPELLKKKQEILDKNLLVFRCSFG